jgi:hypothetical protein
MAKKNRETLKNYFKTGKRPTEGEFEDLIDSTLNNIDEGFDKTPEDGFKVTQLGEFGKLISFYQNIDVKSALWSIAASVIDKGLVFESEKKKDVLYLSPLGKVSINMAPEPELDVKLDVNGTVSSYGRVGAETGTIPADGKWHDIEAGLKGCNAFEIMAGAGEKKKGKYALAHAIAVNTFNSKGKITYTQSYYGTRCARLKLRWSGDVNVYSLQLRSGYCYGKGVKVKYQITRLWFDPLMDDCQGEEE